jgi:hypothetical protein
MPHKVHNERHEESKMTQNPTPTQNNVWYAPTIAYGVKDLVNRLGK